MKIKYTHIIYFFVFIVLVCPKSYGAFLINAKKAQSYTMSAAPNLINNDYVYGNINITKLKNYFNKKSTDINYSIKKKLFNKKSDILGIDSDLLISIGSIVLSIINIILLCTGANIWIWATLSIVHFLAILGATIFLDFDSIYTAILAGLSMVFGIFALFGLSLEPLITILGYI